MNVSLTPQAQRKEELRQTALAKRDRLSPRYRFDAAINLADIGAKTLKVTKGQVVAGYWPIRSEIDPKPLLSWLRKNEVRLCLPAVIDKTTIVFREFKEDSPIVQTGFGTFGPDEHAPLITPDIVFLPLAAFDQRGHRLGYGAGHYDRALARFAEQDIFPELIGLAYDCQEVDEVPNEPHDIALNKILTESDLRSFASA